MSQTPPPPHSSDGQGPQYPHSGPDASPGHAAPQGPSYQDGTQPPPGSPAQDAGGYPAPSQPKKSGMGKGPILAIAGCVALFLVLLLALGAFFGIRALTGDDEAAPAEETSAPQEEPTEEEPVEDETSEEATDDEATEPEATEEQSTEPEATEEATTEEEAAGGEANAVPKGTAVTIGNQGSDASGTVDFVVGDVNWDATSWVAEQNKFNEVPPEGQKYIMVQAEITYHGSAEYSAAFHSPADYVDADGNPIEAASVVTPDTSSSEILEDGGTLTVHWVYMVPADLPEGGYFVIADALPVDEALEEGQWVAAT